MRQTAVVSNAKIKMQTTKLTFKEFKNSFQKTLINRYFWTVKKASEFEHPNLEKCYKEGKDKHEAYFEIFGVEPDLIGN